MMTDNGLAAIAARVRASTVRVHDGSRGSGSGVVWSDGTVVTNAHVVRGASAIVETENGRRSRAALTRRDDARDLAVLRVERGFAEPIERRSARDLQPGELVAAVGNPLGLVGALTFGIVARRSARWIVADVLLEPGNSGGPLVDARGRAVGINSLVAGGLGYAIPSDIVEPFVSASSEPSPRRLGVALAAGFTHTRSGRQPAYVVTAVEPGGAAERLGLALGDTILEADGRTIPSDPARLAQARALTIARAGEIRTLAVAA